MIDFGLGELVMVVLLVDGPEKVCPHTVEGRSRVSERAFAGAAKTLASKPAIASPNIGTVRRRAAVGVDRMERILGEPIRVG